MKFQEFAESKKIFETKKFLGLAEMEQVLIRRVMNQVRPKRSLDQLDLDQMDLDLRDETVLPDTTDPPMEEEETVDEPSEPSDPSEIGEAAGELVQDIIGTLTNSTQDVIELFTEVVESVGEVLEDVSIDR